MAVAYVIFMAASDDSFVDEGSGKTALAVTLNPETGWSEIQRQAEMHFKALQATGMNPLVEFSPEGDMNSRTITVDYARFSMEEVLLVS